MRRRRLQTHHVKDSCGEREFQMDLRFRGFTLCIAKFCDERCFVATLPPRLGNICTN
jgi:hypothetical protein